MEYKNSKRNIVLPLVAAVSVVVGIVIGFSINSNNRMTSVRSINLSGGAQDKLEKTLTLIRSQYVDNVNMDSIAENVIPVLLENLDPHSVYFPASELAQANEPLEGQFDGVGVTFNMMTDTVLVISVISGGPSAKAGVQPGDRIVTVNDSIIAGKSMNQNDVVGMLRGPRNSKVTLGIKRVDVDGLLQIEVTRGIIPVKSLDADFMIDDKIGYIKLTRFSRNSHLEVMVAVKKLQLQGMEKLILDLRGNSGGFIDQPVLIVNEFLPDKSLIVYTENKSRRRNEQYSNGKGTLQDMPLAVLIDEGSASASEIVAGALQDNDRGIIVGRRSFGKGLVQEQMPYGDGSAVRLTIARYYTPVGRLIQKPYDNGIEEYRNEMEIRFNHDELFNADSIKFADSLKYVTPGGKVVYGGGGIMPDVFVPLDTTGYNKYVREVFARNTLVRYTMEYSDRHRAELNKIEDISQMNEYFDKQPSLLDDFVAYAAAKGITAPRKEIEEGREILEVEIKALIARSTPLEDNGFYQMILPLDTVIKKTVDILE